MNIEKNNINENENINKKDLKNIKDNNQDFNCLLKWKGIIKKKNFYHFQVLIIKNQQELLEFLEENNLIHLVNNIN